MRFIIIIIIIIVVVVVKQYFVLLELSKMHILNLEIHNHGTSMAMM